MSYATVKSSTRRSNRFIEIKNSLSSIDRKTNTTTFAIIDEISIKKKWNAIKIENFESYTNNYNFKNSLITSLIFRNRLFTIKTFSKQAILSINYRRRKKNDVIAIIENTNFNMFIAVFNILISQTFNIFFSSTFFFFYINHTKL